MQIGKVETDFAFTWVAVIAHYNSTTARMIDIILKYNIILKNEHNQKQISQNKIKKNISCCKSV